MTPKSEKKMGWLLFACLWSLYLALPAHSIATKSEQPRPSALSSPLPSFTLLQQESKTFLLMSSDKGEDTDGDGRDSHGTVTDDGSSRDSGDDNGDDDDDDDDSAAFPDAPSLLEEAAFLTDIIPTDC